MACASKKSFRWVTTLADLAKRTSEKWPNGGIGRRSISRMPCGLSAPALIPRPRKLQPPTQLMRQWREPSFEKAPRASVRPDTGDQHDFAARTRANSLSVASAFGTVVITYWATIDVE